MATPVRALGTRQQNGWILLRDVQSEYADGAEQRVYEICKESSDLTSTSTELIDKATTWPERYHLAPERSNVIRAFDIPDGAVALEVGAGCGAVTRYLGEVCQEVDALEPAPTRAQANRERCRDLDNVEVFVGALDDVPPEPTYDLIVVIGVLEYVGSGAAELSYYREFLAQCAALLKDGGSLVLAIENKLGVKYLVGAPEDHSGRHYDSIEGYPGASPARTFDRRQLVELIGGAGLRPDLQIAFPDYKLPRAIFRPDAIPHELASLLWRVPKFPSPDWAGERGGTANEGRVWETLVRAGLAADFGNSFVMSATKGTPTADDSGSAGGDLWPTAQLGAYFSQRRRSPYAVSTRIIRSGDSVCMKRTKLTSEVTSNRWVEADDRGYVPGDDFLNVFVDTNDAHSRELLLKWADLVRRLDASAPLPLDLVPHNLIVRPDTQVTLIDDEWRTSVDSVDMLLRRGCLILVLEICDRGVLRGDWAGTETVRQAVSAIGHVVGIEGDGWIDDCVRNEAAFASSVFYRQGDATPEKISSIIEQDILHLLGTPIRDADRAPDSYLRLRDLTLYLEGAHRELEKRVEGLRRSLSRAESDNYRLRESLAALDQQYSERISIIHNSTSWRLGAPVRKVGTVARSVKNRARRMLPSERTTETEQNAGEMKINDE